MKRRGFLASIAAGFAVLASPRLALAAQRAAAASGGACVRVGKDVYLTRDLYLTGNLFIPEGVRLYTNGYSIRCASLTLDGQINVR